MKFLRTVSTGRLLAILAGAVIAVAGGTAIAIAATSNRPTPAAKPLAQTLEQALSATPQTGITATIKFTNNLISSTDFTGETTDPILQGTPRGRVWLSKGDGLRVELESDNGDTELVLNKGSFWISDPASQTVYEGTLPAGKDGAASGTQSSSGSGVPTVSQIQADLNKLMAHVNVSGARTSNPTDYAGQRAYSVSVSPKHDGGLLGSASVAWDALTGTPLDISVSDSSGNKVLDVQVTDISFGPIAPSVFQLSPPPGYKVVKVATPSQSQTASATGKTLKKLRKSERADVTGVAAVASHVPFALAAPKTLGGLPRQDVKLLDWGGKPAALVTYGKNLGGIAVIEQSASGSSSSSSASSGSGGGESGLSLPSVSVAGATGTELSTALGTVLHFTKSGVSYTVLGSVPPAAANAAAGALVS